jgi:NAD(P)-dependent dehydrogenase (short-subunit alcohol dehydrogenase family)
VNNAGVLMPQNLLNCTEEQFDTSMNVNVRSAFTLTKTSVPHLQKSDLKSIVNVSSIAGLRAYKNAISYKVSKAAMDQLTRCSALEVASKGIRVNSVNPGLGFNMQLINHTKLCHHESSVMALI